MSFWWSPLFYIPIIPWYRYIYNDIIIFFFRYTIKLFFRNMIQYFFVKAAKISTFFCIWSSFLLFCSRIVNIIAEIFIPHRIFVYKSWTIYKIQNVQNTKFFADYKIQNTKFIFYIDKILFLEHFKCPLFKGISFIFVNKWLIQQIKQ